LKIIKLVVIAFTSLASTACYSLNDECRQNVGNRLVSEAKYSEGFKLLKFCENDQSVTGLTLGQLAVLYGDFGFGEFKTKKERAQKIYDLYLMAAAKGNEDAVMTLISIFDSGEPLILLAPNPSVSECLSVLADAENYQAEKINGCIGEIDRKYYE
jgi:hypothetical protein